MMMTLINDEDYRPAFFSGLDDDIGKIVVLFIITDVDIVWFIMLSQLKKRISFWSILLSSKSSKKEHRRARLGS